MTSSRTHPHNYLTKQMSAPQVYTLPRSAKTIVPGSIPEGTERVDAHVRIFTELLPGAIPDSVTHMYVKKLTSNIHIPSTVKHLAVLDFKKKMIAHVPDTVTHLYVHVLDSAEAPLDQIHYLFILSIHNIGSSIKKGFNLSKPFDKNLFGYPWTIVKCIPKHTAVESKPEPPTETGIIVGKTYTELIINDAEGTGLFPPIFTGLLRPGSIPSRFTCVNLKNNSVAELEPGVITDSVTHLYLRELNEHMAIPSSVTHLAILNYKSSMLQYVPPTVTHLHIHYYDRAQAPVDLPHYLFNMCPIERSECERGTIYSVSESYEDQSFGYSTNVVKRELTIGQAMSVIKSLKAENARLQASSA